MNCGHDKKELALAVLCTTAWIFLQVHQAVGQDLALGSDRWHLRTPGTSSATDCQQPNIFAPSTQKPADAAPQVPLAPEIPSERFAALSSETVALADSSVVGYIDPAIPRTLIRVRYDDMLNDNRPDRAEFLFAKFGFFSTPASASIAGVPPDPNAKGPLGPDGDVNWQELSTYLELAFDHKFSVFVDLPVRFVHPLGDPRHAGFGDMSAGIKYAFLYQEHQIATFQLRTYIPTGDSAEWLGNNHVSLEPGLLYFRGLTNRLSLEGELKDWIPIGGSNFAGNIVNYGLGLSYRVWDRCKFKVSPVVEFVGWTVLDGKESVVFSPTMVQVKEAGGDTIINAKAGVRLFCGDHSDFYVGYGRALTGDVWYKDIFRLEYRWKY
jgi:hypothetical protein